MQSRRKIQCSALIVIALLCVIPGCTVSSGPIASVDGISVLQASRLSFLPDQAQEAECVIVGQGKGWLVESDNLLYVRSLTGVALIRDDPWDAFARCIRNLASTIETNEEGIFYVGIPGCLPESFSYSEYLERLDAGFRGRLRSVYDPREWILIRMNVDLRAEYDVDRSVEQEADLWKNLLGKDLFTHLEQSRWAH